jgi:hypothetical protein
MLQNDHPARNFRSFRVGWHFQERPERAGQAATADHIYRAIVERHFGKTYWTSAFRKSMSSEDMLATETGRNKAGGGSARNHIKPAGPETGRRAPEQRRHRQREPRT